MRAVPRVERDGGAYFLGSVRWALMSERTVELRRCPTGRGWLWCVGGGWDAERHTHWGGDIVRAHLRLVVALPLARFIDYSKAEFLKL